MAAQAPGADDRTPRKPRPPSARGRRLGQRRSPAPSSKSRQGPGRATAVGQLPNGRHDKLSGSGDTSLSDRKKEQQLQQEQAIFEQEQAQNRVYFHLRATMGIVVILVIPAEIVINLMAILDPHQDAIVKRIAESTLLSMTLLVGYVWRVFVNRTSVSRPRPVTIAEEASPETRVSEVGQPNGESQLESPRTKQERRAS